MGNRTGIRCVRRRRVGLRWLRWVCRRPKNPQHTGDRVVHGVDRHVDQIQIPNGSHAVATGKVFVGERQYGVVDGPECVGSGVRSGSGRRGMGQRPERALRVAGEERVVRSPVGGG